MKKIFLTMTLLAALAVPVTSQAAGVLKAPKDDRAERRAFEARTDTVLEGNVVNVTPPQDDRTERRAYEERLKTNIEEIKDLKADLIEARQERAEAERREETAEKQNREERALQLQKEILVKAVDTMTDYMERMKERADLIINVDLKNKLMIQAQAYVSVLTDLRARVGNAKSSEELRAVAQALQEMRSESTRQAQEQAASVQKLLILGLIDRFEQSYIAKAELRAKLISEALTRYEQAGKDVTTARALLSSAQERIQTVRSDSQELKNHVNTASTIDGKILATSRVELNGMKNDLKTVYETFLEIGTHVKAL